MVARERFKLPNLFGVTDRISLDPTEPWMPHRLVDPIHRPLLVSTRLALR